MTDKADLTILKKAAYRRIKDIEQKWGKGALHLAYHAALPVALNADFLHLLRINFFLDPPEVLPYTTEVDLLLSSFCHEIGEGLYEIDSNTRDLLLEGLIGEYGQERIRDVATLLWQYSANYTPWENQAGLLRAQQLTALNFLDPSEANKWLETAETSTHTGSATDREWFVAMNQSLQKQMPLIENAQITEIWELFAKLEYILREFVNQILESRYGLEWPNQFGWIQTQGIMPLAFLIRLISEEEDLFKEFFGPQKIYNQIIEVMRTTSTIRDTLAHSVSAPNFTDIQKAQQQTSWLLATLQEAQRIVDANLSTARPSKLQQRIYEFIRNYIQTEGMPPTNQEIGQAMKIASTGHVDYHLSMLEKKGYIQREPKKSRGIRLIQQHPRPTLIRATMIAGGEPLQWLSENAASTVTKSQLEQWLEKLQEANEQQAIYQIFLQFIQELTNSGYNQIFLLSRNDSGKEEIHLVADLIDQGKVTYDIASWNGLIGKAIKSRKTIVVALSLHFLAEQHQAASRSTKISG